MVVTHALGQDTIMVDIDSNQAYDSRLFNLGAYPFKENKDFKVKFRAKGIKTPVAVCNLLLAPVNGVAFK